MKALLPGLYIGLSLALLAPAAAHASAPRHVTDPAAPRALATDGPVSVSWTDPARFTEITHSGNRWEAARGNWVNELASHLADTAAARLPQDQRLEVTITDIDLAGDYEPWRGPRAASIRLLRDIYPPQIRLHYVLRGGDGGVLAEQDEVLGNLGYLQGLSTPSPRNRNLHHEKRLIERWVAGLLPGDGRTTASR